VLTLNADADSLTATAMQATHLAHLNEYVHRASPPCPAALHSLVVVLVFVRNLQTADGQ
jgi:hypothetical protein